MRLHLVSLPHTKVEPEFSWCAYTGKVLKFCKMMGSRHEIILYAPGNSFPPGVTEFVSCLSDTERTDIFGPDDLNRLPEWPNDEQTFLFNTRVTAGIAERRKPGDIVLLSQGLTHNPIKMVLSPKMLCCEPGVGYEGIIGEGIFCAYESHAWRHYLAHKYSFNNLRTYDTVIHPYCDPDEFPILNDGKGEYLLYYGRLIQRKGIQIAVEISNRTKLPLYVAGAGAKRVVTIRPGKVKIEGHDCTIEGNLVHVGPVNIEQRAKLLAGAKALICPTLYLEPGGNVAIEAMLAGTPVITHDWGVYSETVKHGFTGFHFQILKQAVKCVERCGELNAAAIREYAIANFSLDVIGRQFDEWFEVLQTLRGKGWYEE